MNLTKDQIRQYFTTRLPNERIARTAQTSVHCPFHEDRSASMSINLEKGVWHCHAGCGEGGMVEFETRISKCDKQAAWGNICDLVGVKQTSVFRQQPEAVYQYRDSLGRLVFEKLRYPGKHFTQRRPDGKGGWEYKLSDCIKPLYNLPRVVTSTHIVICEGEKDADNVNALGLGTAEYPLVATTNFDGAGKWREEYAPYFAGRHVVIFPDNDAIGNAHAETVARSVSKYAEGVKVIHLPGLLEKQDVSDYLTIHTKDDLLREIKQAPRWIPKAADPEHTRLADCPTFVKGSHLEVDWMVDGVIQRGSNGFFCAVPKAGKSWAATDLAVSLAVGSPWMGRAISRPVRTALVSREDNPALTAWRLRQLILAKERAGYSVDLVGENLWINTREQTPTMLLDDREEVEHIIEDFKEEHIEFAIFDVFNVLHHADENDNTEMRKVLDQFSRVHREVGCGIGIIHHYNKGDSGSMTQRMRGSSAIAGWAEWLIGISIADEESRIRRMEFEGKAASPPNPVHFVIQEQDGITRIELADWARQESANRRGRAM